MNTNTATISTALCGLALSQSETTLSTRRMLAYAAGIGDLSPRVFDDSHSDFMASPTLCVALEWPVISDPANVGQIVSDPREAARAVHLSQDSHFHRPMRVGDRLTTGGNVVGIWRGAAGVRVASTLRTVDTSGAAVVTSHTVAVYRDVDAVGSDRPALDLPALPKPDGTESDMLSADFVIDTALPHRYTECSAIWNPIHTERCVAKAAGLPDVILHGTATWALAGAEIVRQLAGGDPARLKRLHGRFGALVFPGTTLQLQFQFRRSAADTLVFFSVLTPQGQKAIANGFALLAGQAGCTQFNR